MNITNNLWLRTPLRKIECTSRVFCFPHAGAGTSSFVPWAYLMSSGIEWSIISYPGRENRLFEQPICNIYNMTQTICEVITPLTHDYVFAFYGHSMGALIAFETARALRRNGYRIPTHLYLSGCNPPTDSTTYGGNLANQSDEDLLARLNSYNGTSKVLLDNPEMMEIFLPILRNDFRVLDSYSYVDEPPLCTNITIFYGTDDQSVNTSKINQWKEHTNRRYKSRGLSGGHFFIYNDVNLSSIAEEINSDLAIMFLE